MGPISRNVGHPGAVRSAAPKVAGRVPIAPVAVATSDAAQPGSGARSGFFRRSIEIGRVQPAPTKRSSQWIV